MTVYQKMSIRTSLLIINDKEIQSGIAISTATALVLFIRFMTTWSSVIAGIIALKFAKFNKI